MLLPGLSATLESGPQSELQIQRKARFPRHEYDLLMVAIDPLIGMIVDKQEGFESRVISAAGATKIEKTDNIPVQP